MTDPPPGTPPPWRPPPGPGWGPPAQQPPQPPPGPGWGPPEPKPPSWGPPPAQPWPPPWPAPPPPPPRRSRTGLIIGLCAGAVVLVVVVLAGAVVLLGRTVQEPRANLDHWHTAYGVFVCDRYLAPVVGSGDRNGIHSHDDGIVHVEPLNRASAGSNAVFRRFEEAQQLQVTSSSLRWIDGPVPVEATVAEGCGGREAEIASFVDGRRVGGPPGQIRLRDGQVIVVALVPKGTSYAQIGPPPSEDYLPRVRGLVP